VNLYYIVELVHENAKAGTIHFLTIRYVSWYSHYDVSVSQ